jgi:hypothetical protein
MEAKTSIGTLSKSIIVSCLAISVIIIGILLSRLSQWPLHALHWGSHSIAAEPQKLFQRILGTIQSLNSLPQT